MYKQCPRCRKPTSGLIGPLANWSRRYLCVTCYDIEDNARSRLSFDRDYLKTCKELGIEPDYTIVLRVKETERLFRVRSETIPLS